MSLTLVLKSFAFSFLVFASSIALSKEQIVTAELGAGEFSAGDQISILVSYTSTNSELTTGLGLNLHYDSSQLSQAEVSNILDTNNIGYQFTEDSNDSDNSAATDKIFTSTWVDFGAGGWPQNSTLPVVLYKITFVATNSFSNTVVNFSPSSGAAGYKFLSNQLEIAEPKSGLNLTIIKAALDAKKNK